MTIVDIGFVLVLNSSRGKHRTIENTRISGYPLRGALLESVEGPQEPYPYLTISAFVDAGPLIGKYLQDLVAFRHKISTPISALISECATADY